MFALPNSFHRSFLPKLREISFAGTRISHKGAEALAKTIIASSVLQFLEKITLPECDGQSLLTLATLGTGQVINVKTLSSNLEQLGNEGFIELAKAIEAGRFKSLEKLDLLSWSSRFEVTDGSLESLAAAFCKGYVANLRKLRLAKYWMGDDGVVTLAEAINLGGLLSLEELDLSGNIEVTDRSLKFLTAAFCKRCATNLRELRLANIGWDDHATVKLAEAIESGGLPLLEKLDLSGNIKVTDRSLKFLTAAFRKECATNLRELRLARIGLGDDVIVELAGAISSGNLRSLETLDISNSVTFHNLFKISSVASEAASYGERGGFESYMRILRLNTDIGFDMYTQREKSMASLAASSATRHMTQLKELRLNGTVLGIDGVRQLVDAMQFGKLRSLEQLLLSGNPKLQESYGILASSFMKLNFEHIAHLRMVDLDDQHVASNIKQRAKDYRNHPNRHIVHTIEGKGENAIMVVDVEGKTEDIAKGKVEEEAEDVAKGKVKEEIEEENEEQDNESTSRSFSSQAPQFRSEIRCLGFESRNQVFNPSRILVLGDVSSSEEQVDIILFYEKAMTSLLGIGLLYSIVSIFLSTEEIMEKTWKSFWVSSEGDFKPFLFERTKRRRTEGDYFNKEEARAFKILA